MTGCRGEGEMGGRDVRSAIGITNCSVWEFRKGGAGEGIGEIDGGGREDGWGCRKVSGRGLGRFSGETGRWPEGGGRCWRKVEREKELVERMAARRSEGGGGSGGLRRRRRLVDGGVAVMAEKNRGQGKEWRRSSRRRRRRRRRRLDSLPGLP